MLSASAQPPSCIFAASFLQVSCKCRSASPRALEVKPAPCLSPQHVCCCRPARAQAAQMYPFSFNSYGFNQSRAGKSVNVSLSMSVALQPGLTACLQSTANSQQLNCHRCKHMCRCVPCQQPDHLHMQTLAQLLQAVPAGCHRPLPVAWPCQAATSVPGFCAAHFAALASAAQLLSYTR